MSTPCRFQLSALESKRLAKYLGDVVNIYDEVYPDLRWGQAYIAALEIHRPKLAKSIVGTDVDPYFNDKLLPSFMDHIADNWNAFDKDV